MKTKTEIEELIAALTVEVDRLRKYVSIGAAAQVECEIAVLAWTAGVITPFNYRFQLERR